MNLALILEKSFFIKLHLVCAIIAFALGAYQLLAKKGSYLHRQIGYIWSVMMVVIAASSFWIKEIMPNSIFWGYSPIHILSIAVLFQIPLAIYFARQGKIHLHKKIMFYNYIGGIIIAGIFTFLPSRLLYQSFFG
jgi:uncharacterized membrane protein